MISTQVIIMKTVILLCLFCISFSHGAPAEEAVVSDKEVAEVPEVPEVPEAAEVAEVPEIVPAQLEAVEEDAAEGAATFIQCPTGWFRYGSRCFFLVKTRMSWLNAENHCVGVQGALPSVQSLGEHQFLQNLVLLAGQTSVWIGAYNFQNTWRWIDRAGFYYSNWQSLSSVSSYPCGSMRDTAGWVNTNCATTLPFFCVKIPEC